MAAYYNENDPKIAAWLRELIKAKLIADGDVDERSIEDVQPADVMEYKQCHFFAGIGGWSYALHLAGWPDETPVWTGSCPCQPFSQAGQRKGEADERHLWPEFRRLIAKCRPAICFGEQVTSDDGLIWLTRVRSDLEEMGYAVGCADLCAAGEGSPQKRQRLYWLGAMACAKSGRWRESIQVRKVGVASSSGRQADRFERSSIASLGNAESGNRKVSILKRKEVLESGRASGFVDWSEFTIAQMQDGCRRISVESRSFPLAHGVPNRVVRLRGYGNAIVPQVAATFIKAYMST